MAAYDNSTVASNLRTEAPNIKLQGPLKAGTQRNDPPIGIAIGRLFLDVRIEAFTGQPPKTEFHHNNNATM